MQTKIGIIGCGNMGRAIFERLKDEYSLLVFDKDTNKTKDLSGVNVSKSITDLFNKSEAIILAIKPQDFESLLKEIKNNIKDKVIISIAAGIATEYIQKILGKVKVIRVMPNMPAKIGKGMSCLCKGQFAKEEDLIFAKSLFEKLGETLVLNEYMMDAATAESGSGPAYVAFFMHKDNIDINNQSAVDNFKTNVFIPMLVGTAVDIGFSKNDAILLAQATTTGTISLMQKEGLSTQQLQKQVASPGGTTEAALEVLHKGGTLEEAVKAALKRAKELSKKG